MKKSELKEMIKAAMSEDMGKSVFDTNKPSRIEEFIKALDGLVDEYHAELYLNDELFAAINDVKTAAKSEMGREDTINEAEKVDVKDDEEVDVDIEKDVEIDDEPVESDIEITDTEEEVTSELDGTNQKTLKALEAALESARELGDEKLINQIGNTITFFTRQHIVKEKDLFERKRMLRLAGILK
jgi:hypothetical protein